MRPLLLHLENFGSFRAPVTIDFSDIDYFALIGPTGAGKSTVIDAICFALYGTVPRWGKENVIAHALAPSAAAGKVALVFQSAGRRHGVVRALQRDSKGTVRTKEARLDELDPAVEGDLNQVMEAVLRPVAEGDAVTPEVQRVTGLEYKFFTQCVVLPQGRFAEFLHAAPRERQDLLVQLLDADVYERIRQRAVREEEASKQAASFARDQLGKLVGADAAAEQAAGELVARLRALAERLDLDLLRAREEEIRRAMADREAVAVRVKALQSLLMPAEVPTLAETARQAADAVTAVAEEVAALEADEHRAHDELAALGDRQTLAQRLAALDEHERVTASAADARTAAARARDALPRLAEAARKATEALAAAERERDRLRDAHTAADLAARLSVGEPCPTCLRPLTELPHHPALSDVGTAERALSAARAEAESARTRFGKAETEAAMLDSQVAAFAARLAELPPPGERTALEERMAAVRKADEVVAEARRAVREGRARLEKAQRAAESAGRRSEQAWRELELARDRVLSLGAHPDGGAPPPVDREDLHRAWTALIGWRDEAGRAARAVLTEREAELARVEAGRTQERARLVRLLADHEITVAAQAAPDQIGAAVATAVARAEGRLERVREDRERARGLEALAVEKEQEARVAHELTLLLRANAFERWLCAEALELLVATASDTLRELSDGQYELTLGGKGDIEVIDHGEAGMRRSARTLSGGETFQAALALALALSGTVARSLDSIFLDEGFGTLDPATLDTVAATLERLAAGRDRMVGVVTHVPALADRVPVRFEIGRDAKGSHLRRVGP
ncbi:SMC family ATPase [Nonomuraea sp. NPDC049152]|uniref:SMC family ATPase n=1 Tax=Nonomuraea sp. NPDC049152 TaxID=3154350 RepID=UPI0033D16C37